jgi:hypothetical protein
MKKFLTPLFAVFFGTSLSAQNMALNTDGSAPDTSAILHLKSSNRGFLMPAMTKTQRNAIFQPATGLLMYQTGPDSTGFHYYNGSQWTWLSSSANAWGLTGNSGTNPANHFIGTTDNNPLVFRTQNSEIMRMTSAGTIGIGTATPNSTYGFARMELASEGFGAPTDLLIRNAANSGGYAPGLVFQHARGTLATPLAVINGDYLGAAVASQNYSGSTYVNSHAIDLYVDGAVTGTIVPGRFEFSTMNTTGNYSQRLTIKNDGKIGIGTTTPVSLLANTSSNTIGVGIVGINEPSLSWAMNTGGYTAAFYNAAAIDGGNGLLVKIAGTGSLNRILDLSVGATQAVAGTSVMVVNGNGTVGIGTVAPASTLQVNGTIAIGVTMGLAGGPIATPVPLVNEKSYIGCSPADNTNNFYQLPNPASCTGRIYYIRNNSSSFFVNIVTAAGNIFPGSSNTVAPGNTYTLQTSSSVKTVICISDGTNWTVGKID